MEEAYAPSKISATTATTATSDTSDTNDTKAGTVFDAPVYCPDFLI
jgi:hypothetical protein